MRRARTGAFGRLLLVGGLLCAAVSPAAGELRRLEAVGVVPIGAAAGAKGVPRDRAVRAAVQAAVLRVARSLVPEDFVPPEPDPPAAGEPPPPLPEPDAWIEEQLGDDPFAYAVRFSILEDRGPRPAVFATEPGVDEEYVVVAEVHLDVDAIRERLAEVGALVDPSAGTARQVILVIEGLQGYRPLSMLREALLADRGVRSVVPIEFTSERVRLAVDADRGASGLLEDLQERAPAGLQIIPLEAGADAATLLLGWSPPAAPDEDLAPEIPTD